jgi:hypothetical protein
VKAVAAEPIIPEAIEKQAHATIRTLDKLIEDPVQDTRLHDLARAHDHVLFGRKQEKKHFKDMQDQVTDCMPHPQSLNQSSTDNSKPDRPHTTKTKRTEYQSKICKSAERRRREHFETQPRRMSAMPDYERIMPESSTESDSPVGLVSIPSF